MKKVNFNAGPSILSQFTIERTAEAVKELDGIGLSLMEISHRSKEFTAIMEDAQSMMKEVLEIPDGYSVLYLGGGANLQFCMIPFNLLNKKAAYLNTGSWATKALKEAQFFGEVIEVATSKDKNFSYIPSGYSVPNDADYLHITTNNTIYGTEIKNDMDVNVPLVADMSSDILSRPVDISKYSLIYGGAQKNLGPAGVAFVIVKDDILGKVDRQIPYMLDYKVHIDKGSLYNTPPVVPVYSCLQTLKWIKQIGGLTKIHQLNKEKAQLLYDELDRNKLFKGTVTNEKDRSIMNVTFVMTDEYKELEKDFLEYATGKGMVGIKGHRSVGGFRASIYNAMTKEGVQALIDAMKEFETTR